MSSPPPTLNRRRSIIDYISSLPSIRSRRSTASLNSTKERETSSSSSYAPYAVHQQNMAPAILRDPEATAKLLETILESQGGRRALARLARTCKAFKEPALDMLWKDLNSFIPLITLFPGTALKRARRPDLGLVSTSFSAYMAFLHHVSSSVYLLGCDGGCCVDQEPRGKGVGQGPGVRRARAQHHIHGGL